MSLQIGQQLGSYEIMSLIGKGGMGEVYRAHDARLGRDVAIKVLPEQFSKDADRLRRFEQEARAAGILNHPNIIAIYDVGTDEGAPYVVSEFLKGGTLREVLESRPIAFRLAVDYAAQIAGGLSAAHDKGIVHRDLKPDNVFITKDGRAKILDFGLAKLSETQPVNQSALPTMAGGTEPGVVMGTVGYMSPEQVRGQTVDHRSDIFSFGCILYEMLSGRRAFKGESGVETMSAILKEEPPDLSAEHPHVPLALSRIIRRCLEKLPDRRFRSAADLEFALNSLAPPTGSGSVSAAAGRPRRIRSRFATAIWMFVALAVLATVAGIFVLRKPQVPSAPVWNGSLLVGGSTVAFGPRVSPDGRTVAFLVLADGLTQLGVLQVNSGDWELRTTKKSMGYIRTVSWSRDGSKIFFDRVGGDRDRVFSVPAVGGDERLVLEDAKIGDSLADGSLLVNRSIAGRYQLHRFWPDTARLEALPVFPVDALSVMKESAQ
jgi:serine/threonine protein kinase